MNPAQIIAKKRDGGTLTAAEIAWFVGGFTRGEIPDYQMSALAMAIYLRGMDSVETAALTEAMLRSGTTIGPRVDKHSTGGLGDKVSLVLAPLLACCGLVVPMISGRGLGATGGTLDKLEAIPGFRTQLSLDEIRRIADRVGCVIAAATEDLVPADRKLYRLRDVTATVASIPLITASIMSKKLAENLSALVLDVKFGSGAFMKSLDEARTLARSMVAVGNRQGVRTTALLTDMNQPLGRMCGHSVEVNESIWTLEGHGPADLVEITLALGAELLVATGVSADRDTAIERQRQLLHNGQGLAKFREMVQAQGGDLDAIRPVADAQTLETSRAGYVQAIETEELGWAIIELGGGRRVMTDAVDHSVGLEMLVRVGDYVALGQPWVRVFSPRDRFERVAPRIAATLTICDAPCPPLPLIVERIEATQL